MATGLTDYTTEQLLAITAGLGLDDPLFLRGAPISDWPENVRTEVEMLGVRSLLSRDLIRVEGGQMRVPLVLRHLMVPLCEATMVTTVARADKAGTLVARLYSRKGQTTVHQPALAGNHRLRGFATSRLPEALVRLTHLRKVEPVGNEPIKIDEETASAVLRQLVTSVEEGQAFDPTTLNLPPETFEPFANFTTDMALATVTVVRRDGDRAVEGATVSWLDDPAGGQWLVERTDQTVSVSPASGDEILGSVLSGFGGDPIDLSDVDWGVGEVTSNA
ncbi:MAG: hypothetical protein GY925_15105 [Actinomycetia bacterium]|nr:hypothetical protein [Actinomycetes bacterium]